MITAGNWKAGNWGVVSDYPYVRTGYTWEHMEDEYRYYGGYLVAESCSHSDAQLIAAAPEMLRILTYVTEANEDVPTLPFWVYWEMKRAIMKATGETGATWSPFAIVQSIKQPLQPALPEAPKNVHHSYYSQECKSPWIRI